MRELSRALNSSYSEGRSGTLSKEEFLSIKELQGNPLLERVIDVFDENGDGEVQFTEFISSLAVFSQNGNDDAKLRCERTASGKGGRSPADAKGL